MRLSFIALAFVAFLTTSCSTDQLIVSGVRMAGSLVGSTHKAVRLYNEIKLFSRHWEILNEDQLYWPETLPVAQKKEIEEDLQELLNDVYANYELLFEGNSDLQLYSKTQIKPSVEIELSNDIFAYVKQDIDNPIIVVSIGLLASNLRAFTELVYEDKRKFRDSNQHLSEEDLSLAMTEKISIPKALEYKDSLRFLLAHETVHVLFDPPLRAGEATQEIEARADALGLVMTAKSSFIVEVKQNMYGVTNLVLIVNGNTSDSMYSPVLYARFGPELLFDLHRYSFEPATSNIYQSVDERIAAAKTYMDRSVSENIHTSTYTFFEYLINSIKTGGAS